MTIGTQYLLILENNIIFLDSITMGFLTVFPYYQNWLRLCFFFHQYTFSDQIT